MDSATIIVVTLFIVLFCTLFLAPMLWLLHTTGKDLRETKRHIRKNEEEIRKLISKL